MTRMPWGKYKGDRIDEVPLGYLAWLLEEGRSLEPTFERHVRVEVASRLGLSSERTARPALPAPHIADAAAEMVSLGFRALAKRAHPDQGGSHHAMLAANEARDWLRGVLGA